MNILWITNIIFPAPSKALGRPSPVVGGWMYASAKALVDLDPSVNLAVATVYDGDQIKRLLIEGITYYLLPLRGNNTRYHFALEPLWQTVATEFLPDIVHLHGTEFAHGLAFLNAVPEVKAVASIQGLVSIYAQYYYAGISTAEILWNISFRDIVRMDTLFHQKWNFERRGLIEGAIIRKVHHIVGRTEWDRAHVLALNPSVNYHFCNETLRSSYYGAKWSYDCCEKHSIFLSQAGYPLKGLHQVLKALSLLVEYYPDLKLYIAGSDITRYNSVIDKMKISGYGLYIRRLIKRLKLSDRVFFTESLNETEMVQRYLDSNIFICPSSIENSPNSLGEAQLLGVPVIASYVGGVPDMVEEGVNGTMYRFEEWEILAQKITSLFEQDQWEDNSEMARIRHDSKTNTLRLITIYREIYG